MNKICVLAINNHPGYQFYLPIVEHCWNQFGWDVVVFVTSDVDGALYRNPQTRLYKIPDIEGVRTNTLAQTVRHFTGNVLPKDAYVMVQDIDLIPLRPHEPDLTKRTIWGYPEMTGGAFIPVHYTGMSGQDWYDLMDCSGDLKADMERELKANGRAYGEKWEEYWDTDWDILTTKVLAQSDKFTFVPRQMVNGLPYGRVDRSTIVVAPDGSYSWGSSGEQAEYMDMHCESNNPSSPAKWENIKSILVKVFGSIPEWMDIHASKHYEQYGIK